MFFDTNPADQKREGRSTLLNEVIAEVQAMPGLDGLRETLNTLIAMAQIAVIRRDRDLPQIGMALHMIFSGPPGTGKTVIARKISKLLYAIRFLRSERFVEVDRSELVAPYLGQTAIKVNEVVDRARGGVLFIDEAYTLTTNGDPFGQEAVDTLLKRMEDMRNDLVVIIAGYDAQMLEFLRSNPGLKSRFGFTLSFPNYDDDVLYQIFCKQVADMKLVLSSDAEREAKLLIKELAARGRTDKGFGNARVVRQVVESICLSQAERLAKGGIDSEIPTTELQQIERIDVECGFSRGGY